MVYFQTKNSNLGKFWRILQWKVLVYVIVRGPLVFFPHFGVLCHETIWQPGRSPKMNNYCIGNRKKRQRIFRTATKGKNRVLSIFRSLPPIAVHACNANK
jgi:hypothetical protein